MEVNYLKLALFLYLFTFLLPLGLAQVLPDGVDSLPFVCEDRGDRPEPTTEAEQKQAESRARYRSVLPAYLIAMPATPISNLIMPVEGVRVSDVADTWGGPRSGGRSHEGQDIFAPSGTAIYSATSGYVYRIAESILGGNTVVVVTNAGWRIYYAHLSAYAADLREGQFVTADTLIGYVGNSGNARTTPPHLHLGMYTSEEGACDWDAIDPLPYLVDRSD